MTQAKAYTTKNLRNVVVLGHGGSGKTSLVDALCFVSGASKRHGKVADGAALTFFRPEEKAHGISMYCTPAFAETQDTKVNLLDTPGYLDFASEATAAIRVADAALVVVGGTSGVEVGTETLWRAAADRGLPRMLFVSMLDKETADFDRAYQSVKDRLTDKVVPVEIPVGNGDDFHGIINLFSGKMHAYKKGTVTGEYDEQEIPGDLQPVYEKWHTELLETIATLDEHVLEEYVAGDEIPRQEQVDVLKRGMNAGEIFPLFCGAAELTYGTQALLREMVELFPSPAERPPEVATEGGEMVEVAADPEGPFAALVFKTTSEPHVGELSYFKVMRGSVDSGAEVDNPGRGVTEKLAHLSVSQGKDRFEVPRLAAGDIGVVGRLKGTHTGDTLVAPGAGALKLDPPAFPVPESALAIRAKTRGDDDKLGPALVRLHEEDPTFVSEFDGEMGETIVRGGGELFLEVQFEKLKERHGIEVESFQPHVHYRETLRKEAAAQGRFKRQTGGRGQFGDCHVRLKPRARGEGYEFVDKIVGGAIPGKFLPSVDKGIQEAAARGILAGFPLIDFGAECFDGSYHSVDSSDMAFKVAGSMAFKAAALEAAPVLLEPVMKVEVTCPTSTTGDVMGDINQRRGKVLGMDTSGDRTIIQAVIPQAELYRYASTLRAMTQGRGHHTRALHGYEEVPAHVADKIIAEHQPAEDKE